MKSEKIISLANKMYDCRRAVKSLYGNEWKYKLERYKDIIRREMKADAKEIETAIDICKLIDKTAAEGHILFYMAAAVDMVEPE